MSYSNDLEKLLYQGIKDSVFPGAVAYVCERGNVIFYKAVGNRAIKPKIKPMHKNTLFDLASLTKPVVTATLTMQLVEKKKIKLDQSVRDILDLFLSLNRYYDENLEEFDRPSITIKHLLTHTSGLPAWKPLYLALSTRSGGALSRHAKQVSLLQRNDATKFSSYVQNSYLEAKKLDCVVSYLGKIPLEYETGSKVVYSCLGYILLGKLIERVTNKNLNELARKQIFHPLKMYDTGYNPSSKDTDRCAATEDSSSFQKRMTDNYERHDWREGVIVGQVHDENAHWLGGVAGNAGLFSTAEDLAKYCTALLTCPSILSQSSVDLIKQNHTVGLDGSRGLGWIIMSDGSLYHTGFTGTSIRIDIVRKLFAILLTNRVHPDANNTGILEFRDKFYGKIFNTE